jgi:hypothetical protein
MFTPLDSNRNKADFEISSLIFSNINNNSGSERSFSPQIHKDNGCYLFKIMNVARELDLTNGDIVDCVIQYNTNGVYVTNNMYFKYKCTHSYYLNCAAINADKSIRNLSLSTLNDDEITLCGRNDKLTIAYVSSSNKQLTNCESIECINLSLGTNSFSINTPNDINSPIEIKSIVASLKPSNCSIITVSITYRDDLEKVTNEYRYFKYYYPVDFYGSLTLVNYWTFLPSLTSNNVTLGVLPIGVNFGVRWNPISGNPLYFGLDGIVAFQITNIGNVLTGNAAIGPCFDIDGVFSIGLLYQVNIPNIRSSQWWSVVLGFDNDIFAELSKILPATK